MSLAPSKSVTSSSTTYLTRGGEIQGPKGRRATSLEYPHGCEAGGDDDDDDFHKGLGKDCSQTPAQRANISPYMSNDEQTRRQPGKGCWMRAKREPGW